MRWAFVRRDLPAGFRLLAFGLAAQQHVDPAHQQVDVAGLLGDNIAQVIGKAFQMRQAFLHRVDHSITPCCASMAMKAGQAAASATVLSRQKALQKPQRRPCNSITWVMGWPE